MDPKIPAKVSEFAMKHGYEYVTCFCHRGAVTVYSAFCTEFDSHCIVDPVLILDTKTGIRFATADERLKILD